VVNKDVCVKRPQWLSIDGFLAGRPADQNWTNLLGRDRATGRRSCPGGSCCHQGDHDYNCHVPWQVSRGTFFVLLLLTANAPALGVGR